MIRMYATFALIALAACNSGPDTKYDYSKCGEPVTITVTNEDILDEDGSLALPKGIETDIGLKVTDDEGDLCDPRGIELAFDEHWQIGIVSLGEDVVLKAKGDAFDEPNEPMTVMHAFLGESLHASWPVVSIVNLGGAWNVVVTEKTRYPTGFDFGEVIFTQRGRRMTWEDCTISVVCSRDAVIRGRSFTAEAPEYGLMISAPIDPERNGFAGPWSAKDGDYEGDFIAVRIE